MTLRIRARPVGSAPPRISMSPVTPAGTTKAASTALWSTAIREIDVGMDLTVAELFGGAEDPVARVPTKSFGGPPSTIDMVSFLGDPSGQLGDLAGTMFASPTPHPVDEDGGLSEAMTDLAEVHREAIEEGFEPPTPTAETTGRRLLLAMYTLRPCRFEVYPTQDREVAVYAPGTHGRSVLVTCNADGSVLCLVNLNGQHRRAFYDAKAAAALPDGFIWEALTDLGAAG